LPQLKLPSLPVVSSSIDFNGLMLGVKEGH